MAYAYTLSVLGPLTPLQRKALTALLHNHVTALPDPVTIESPGTQVGCLRWHLPPCNQAYAPLMQACYPWAQQQCIDLVLQPGPLPQIKLACFDMDSTLIQAEVIDELARYAGKGEQVAQITQRSMQGEIDFRQSFEQRMALLQGTPVQVLQQIAEHLTLMPGAQALITQLKQKGVHTAIVSGGFTYFAQRIQQQLGIDQVYANELDSAQQHLSGQIIEPLIDAAAKRRILLQLLQDAQLDPAYSLAVGDGANDIPMLQSAGLGIAFHAKPAVQQAVACQLNYTDLSAVLHLIQI